jgi:1,4-dihydroxy-2-naphthoyl-CoA hydrolase
MIWHRNYTLDELQAMGQNTIHEVLDIRITEIGIDYLCGTMPVDARTHQPAGILHGGASVVLAESLGSIAAALVADPERFQCVGLDINANHIRSKKEGIVTGKATPIHIGRSTQVWAIDICDEIGKRVCIARLTMAVLERTAS